LGVTYAFHDTKKKERNGRCGVITIGKNYINTCSRKVKIQS